MTESIWHVVRFDGQKLFHTNSYPLKVLATFKGFHKDEIVPTIVNLSTDKAKDLYDKIVGDMICQDDDCWEINNFHQTSKIDQINKIRHLFEESWKNHDINSYALIDSKETTYKILKSLGKVVKVVRVFHKNEIQS